MPRRPRRNYAPAFKSTVVLAARKGNKTVAELRLENDFLESALTKAGLLSDRR